MDPYEEILQAELVLQISADLQKVFVDHMKVHGKDPDAASIAAAGFIHAMRQIDKALPNFDLEKTVFEVFKLVENKR